MINIKNVSGFNDKNYSFAYYAISKTKDFLN